MFGGKSFCGKCSCSIRALHQAREKSDHLQIILGVYGLFSCGAPGRVAGARWPRSLYRPAARRTENAAMSDALFLRYRSGFCSPDKLSIQPFSIDLTFLASTVWPAVTSRGFLRVLSPALERVQPHQPGLLSAAPQRLSRLGPVFATRCHILITVGVL